MMNNKRFVLTNNSAKQAELWEIETGQRVHQFDCPFSEAKKRIDQIDLQGTKENPVPNTWMSLDIRLGVSKQ